MESSNVGVQFETDADMASEILFTGYPDALLQAAFVCCVIFVIIGISGNLVTIIALASCRKFRNATAVYIINLHASNLIFCCMIIPMTAVNYYTRHWLFGKTMCSVYPLIKYALSAIGHITVVAITVNRYIMVCHPTIYSRVYSRKNIIISLISIWVVGFAMFLPSFFEVWGRFYLNSERGNCTMVPDKNNSSPKILFVCLAFAVPYLIITICYGRIWWVVRKITNKRRAHIARSLQCASRASVPYPSCLDDAESGQVCQELTVTESSTDDGVNKINGVPLRTNLKTGNRINGPTKKDKKLGTMILALLISFIICNFPQMLIGILSGNSISKQYAFILAQLLEYSTAFISPIIYVIMSNEYRQAYTKLFKDLKAKVIK